MNIILIKNDDMLENRMDTSDQAILYIRHSNRRDAAGIAKNPVNRDISI